MRLLLTASGCPGASTLIRYLRKAYEGIEIIGTDMRDEVIGKILCDKFYTVPPGNSDKYVPEILKIIEAEGPEVLLPESTVEALTLSKHKQELIDRGVIPMISDFKELALAINKHELYEALEGLVPLPEYRLVKQLDDLNAAVRDLGYPSRNVCFKPPVSEGSRGFRIISAGVNRRDLLLKEKPTSKYITLEEVNEIFEGQEFSDLLVMEFVEGMAFDAMTIALDGEALLTTVKTRERDRGGVITYGKLLDEPRIREIVARIIRRIPLKYNIGLQFIGDKLIEINPRVSSFIFQDNLVEPHLAIELARGNVSKDQIRGYSNMIDYGRKMVRYMDQVFY